MHHFSDLFSNREERGGGRRKTQAGGRKRTGPCAARHRTATLSTQMHAAATAGTAGSSRSQAYSNPSNGTQKAESRRLHPRCLVAEHSAAAWALP